MNYFSFSNIDSAPRFQVTCFLLRTLSAGLFMLAFYGIAAAQTTYTFTGEMDDRYENPANWTPAYPGTEIAADQLVFIESTARVQETLQVNGTLHIAVGADLKIDSAALAISETGRLMNDGTIYAAFVYNAGMINNNLAAKITAEAFFVAPGAMTNNLMSAEMTILGDLKNGGVFNNYSTCTVEGDFINAFSYYELQQAHLQVAGEHIEQLTPIASHEMTYRGR